MKARVYKSTGSWYLVKDETGKFANARIPGKFKIDGLTSTNPIAVGDWVDVEPEAGSAENLMITAIDDRKNHIARVSPANKRQQHIIAANLDQSVLFATLKEPKTSQGFIDRFLIVSEAYHVPAIIVFNKTDIYRTKELEKLAEWRRMYEAIGYQVLGISVQTGEGVEELAALLKDKVSLISGHSGVGKSSFINLVLPAINLRTRDVSGWSGKGMHTTTFAEMFDLPFGGQLIDTPGIRELGLADMGRQELSHYFPEMAKQINDCQFNNCLHLNEPGCAVKKAVGTGSIHPDRYISYCTILDSIEEIKY